MHSQKGEVLEYTYVAKGRCNTWLLRVQPLYIGVTPWQSGCRLYKVEGLAKNVLAGLVRQPDRSRVPHGPTLWQQHA